MLTILVDPRIGNYNIHCEDYNVVTYSVEAFLAYGKISRFVMVTIQGHEAFKEGMFSDLDIYSLGEGAEFSREAIDYIVKEYKKMRKSYRNKTHVDKVSLIETILGTRFTCSDSYNDPKVKIITTSLIRKYEKVCP